ncbi:MAG: nitroreductase family protein [Promethearchaeota archaeon]|nr:MAG: nitroreductase family protein [Candidatus Lokiarchaeota archaeon]
MNEFQQQLITAMRTRRSIRRFTNVPIPRYALEILVDMAQYAPCPSGYMVWKFVVVTEDTKLKAVRDALKSFYQGPGSGALTPFLNAYIQTDFYQQRLREFEVVGISGCEQCPTQCEKGKGEFNAEVYACRTWLAYRTATALIVVLSDPIQRNQYRKNAKTKTEDTSTIKRYEETIYKFEIAAANLAIQNILITAHCLGLGACYTHCANILEPQIKKILKIPRGPELVGIICLGYPDVEPTLKPRQAPQDYAFFEEYQQ